MTMLDPNAPSRKTNGRRCAGPPKNISQARLRNAGREDLVDLAVE